MSFPFTLKESYPSLKFRSVQLPLGPLELEAGPLVLDKVQNTRHRVLRPLVLGIAVAAIVAAALVLIVGEGDIRAAGQLAVVILGRGATAILHCGTTKLAGHLHFMTRRPLQQLPFLRRVPRECSPVGQYISIGPSEKERQLLRMRTRCVRVSREKNSAAPLALGRDRGLSSEKAEKISRTRTTVSSLVSSLRRPSLRQQRVDG